MYLYARKSQYYKDLLFKKNYKDIVDVGTGKLITRYSNGVDAESGIFARILHIWVSAIFRGVVTIAILYIFISELILIVCAGIVCLFVLNYFARNTIKKYTDAESKFWEEEWRLKARVIMENLIIRLFGQQKTEITKNKAVIDGVVHNWLRADIVNHLTYTSLELLLRILEIIVFIVIGLMVLDETKSVAYLVMINMYIWFLWWPLDKAMTNLNEINRHWEKYKKLQDFMDQPIDIQDGTKDFEYKKWDIQLQDLHFSYGKGIDIFTNLNLHIRAGKKNAIIGHSGWGKSTIIKILLRLYDYQSGTIQVDGQDLKSLKIDTLYQHIGYLPQEPAIFDGTIRENLEYALDIDKRVKDKGKSNIYDDAIMWEALKDAQVDDMVRNLENWLDTEVGEKGIKLSGGEKQRLAIARIFLKNPEIIILDEPTSALDSISEDKITASLNELMQGKTSIVIAHRLQTVMNADNIVIIENGKIADEGTHTALLKKSKIYKKLVDLQHGRLVE